MMTQELLSNTIQMKHKNSDTIIAMTGYSTHPLISLAQSAGAVEYTDCFSAGG